MELAVTLVPDAFNPTVGDLLLDTAGKEVVRTTTAAKVAQRLTVKFQFFRGEWFLDTRQGVPYYQVLLRKGVSDAVVRAVFSQVILGDPDVESLTTFDITRNKATRKADVTFTAALRDGTVLTSADFAPFLVDA